MADATLWAHCLILDRKNVVIAQQKHEAGMVGKPGRETELQAEGDLVARLRSLATHLQGVEKDCDSKRLPLLVEQGRCIQEAADAIKAAGGVEKWLSKHRLNLGIGGCSRSHAHNLVRLARAGLEQCLEATRVARENPDTLSTSRRSGLEFYVAALTPRQALPPRSVPNLIQRQSRVDRKHMQSEIALFRTWWERAMAELSKATASGAWPNHVYNQLRVEIDRYLSPAFGADEEPAISEPEPRAARAEHRSGTAPASNPTQSTDGALDGGATCPNEAKIGCDEKRSTKRKRTWIVKRGRSLFPHPGGKTQQTQRILQELQGGISRTVRRGRSGSTSAAEPWSKRSLAKRP